MIPISLLLFFSILLFSLFSIKNQKINILILFYYYFAILFFIVFRDGYKVPDYYNYVYIYNNIGEKTFNTDVEFSMSLIIRFLRFLNFNYLSLFVVYGLIGFSIKYKLIEQDAYPYLALLGYFSYSMLNQEMAAMRAGVSIAFILLAIYELGKNKRNKFILFVLIAGVFHFSALTCFGLYFIVRFSKKSSLYCLFIFALIIPFFVPKILLQLLGIIPFEYLQAKLFQYNDSQSITTTFRLSTLLHYFIFLIMLSKYNLLKKRNPEYLIEMQTLLFGILMNSLFAFSSLFQYRISNIYYSIEIFMYKNFIYMFKSKTVGKIIAICFCIINFIYLIFKVRILGDF